jgi:hypothetical protein
VAINDVLDAHVRLDIERLDRIYLNPVARFGKNDRKIDIMRPHLAGQAASGRAGVAAIVVARSSRRSTPRPNTPGRHRRCDSPSPCLSGG